MSEQSPVVDADGLPLKAGMRVTLLDFSSDSVALKRLGYRRLLAVGRRLVITYNIAPDEPGILVLDAENVPVDGYLQFYWPAVWCRSTATRSLKQLVQGYHA